MRVVRLNAGFSYALISILAQFAFISSASAQEDEWRFSVTPYIWLPTVDGELSFGEPPGLVVSPDVEVGPIDYLENLKGVFMIAGEARYELRMADNSIVMAKTISVAQEQVEILEPLLGALQVPRDAVTEIRGIEQRAVTGK